MHMAHTHTHSPQVHMTPDFIPFVQRGKSRKKDNVESVCSLATLISTFEALWKSSFPSGSVHTPRNENKSFSVFCLYNICVYFQPMLVSEEAGSQHSLVPSPHNTPDKAGETDILTFERLYLKHVIMAKYGFLKATRNCISSEQGLTWNGTQQCLLQIIQNRICNSDCGSIWYISSQDNKSSEV